MFSDFDGQFTVFYIVFYSIFFIFIAIFVIAIVRGIMQWNKNNNSPRLSVNALVASKRIDISHHHHSNAGDASGMHGSHTSTSTSYYATFQVDSGDRMELSLSGYDYGMLVEGDYGVLNFQGTRYLGFQRFQ